MTIRDIYTILIACDRARARAVKAKREAEDRLEKAEALRAWAVAQAREATRHAP